MQLKIGKQPCTGRGRRAAKLKYQAAVEIEPQSAPIRLTRRVPHFCRLIPHKILNSSC